MMLLCLHLEWKLKLQGTFFYFISFKVFSLFAYSVKFIFACVFLSFSLSLSLSLSQGYWIFFKGCHPKRWILILFNIQTHFIMY